MSGESVSLRSLTPTQGLGGDSHRGSFCPFRDLVKKQEEWEGSEILSSVQLSESRQALGLGWRETALSREVLQHLHFSGNNLQTPQASFSVGSLTEQSWGGRANGLALQGEGSTFVFPALSIQGNRGASWQNPAATCVSVDPCEKEP